MTTQEIYDTNNSNDIDEDDAFITYAYDLSGNRTRKESGTWWVFGQDMENPGLHPVASDIWTYAYNSDDQISYQWHYLQDEQSLHDGTGYEYDDGGSQVVATIDLITDARILEYHYDLRGRLVELDDLRGSEPDHAQPERITYSYDAQGNRVHMDHVTFQNDQDGSMLDEQTSTYLCLSLSTVFRTSHGWSLRIRSR